MRFSSTSLSALVQDQSTGPLLAVGSATGTVAGRTPHGTPTATLPEVSP